MNSKNNVNSVGIVNHNATMKNIFIETCDDELCFMGTLPR